MTVAMKDRILGCLLGGACGDALGAPFEFTSHVDMVVESGPRGIGEFWTDGGKLGSVTDETQFILFTGNALVASRHDRSLSEVEHLHLAYLSWLSTQGTVHRHLEVYGRRYSHLCKVVATQGDRCPNSETVDALCAEWKLGDAAENDHQSNGAVARVAPIGLLYSADPQHAFCSAVADAQLTHGHPRGYVAAGTFAMLVAWLTKGLSMARAVERTLIFLQSTPDHKPTSDAIINAPWKISDYASRPYWMGFGWSADEALAIAVNAVMTTDCVERAIVVAASHDGDSDTTASMAGNLAGTLYGRRQIPPRWLSKIELRREVEKLAGDLCLYVPGCSRSS